MDAVTDENFAEQLLAAVPETRPDYDEWLRLFDGEPVPLYIILGCVLNPYLLPLLDGDEDSDPESLRRIFAFLERAATSGNTRIEDAVAIAFVEHLLGDTAVTRRTKAWRYMGNATKKMYTDMEDWWKQHQSKPGNREGKNVP